MGAIILYAFILSGSLAALVGLQYGWRPPFAVVWDSLSHLILMGGLAILVFVSSWGLGVSVSPALPRRFRVLPPTVVFTVAGTLLLGSQYLSPTLSPLESALVVGMSAGIGLVLGLLAGAARVAYPNLPGDPEEISETPKKTNARAGTVLMLTVAGCAAFLLLPRSAVSPRVTVERLYESETSALALGHYSLLGERYGVVGITNGDAANTLVLEPSEWSSLSSLMERAEEAQFDGWRVVGLVVETGTDNRGRLELSAGNGIRFHIASEQNPSVTYELQSSDFDSLNAAAARVATAIAP